MLLVLREAVKVRIVSFSCEVFDHIQNESESTSCSMRV